MSKKKRASVIISGGRSASMFRGARPNIVNIASGTFSTACTEGGVICMIATTAGITTGQCYISIDTAGTGTKVY